MSEQQVQYDDGEWSRTTIERGNADTREASAVPQADQSSADDPIPRYAQLDLWMALQLSDDLAEYDKYREKNGFADTWSELLGVVRDRTRRLTQLSAEPTEAEVRETYTVTDRLSCHLRRLARGIKLTAGEASVLRAAAWNLDRAHTEPTDAEIRAVADVLEEMDGMDRAEVARAALVAAREVSGR